MNKKPALIAAGVGLAVILITIVGLILPRASAVKNKQKELEQAAVQEQKLQTDLQQLQAWAQTAPRDRKRLAKLEAQIPSTADLPGLIRLLNNTADESAVDFMTLSPSAPQLFGPVSAVPVQITIAGGFFAVDQYLYLLENLPRVSKVSNIAVTAGQDGLPQLTVAITANFFTTDTAAGPGSVPGGSPPATSVPTPAPSATIGG